MNTAAPSYFQEAVRSAFPNGGLPFTGKASISEDLKRSILDIESRLELHQFGEHVIAYMRNRKQDNYSNDDVLHFQFILKYPPGDWLIACLRECDQWAKSPDDGVEKQLKLYDNNDLRREEIRQKEMSDMREQMRSDLYTYYGRDRKSVTFGLDPSGRRNNKRRHSSG